MADFGYTLSPSARIDLNKAGSDRFRKLVRTEPDVLKCMACGSCTASCTAGVHSPTSVRNAILCLQNGREKEALSLLGGCMLCGKCTVVCPRAINTRHLVLSICKIYNSK